MEFYTSEGIYADPKHPYTQALLSAIRRKAPLIKKNACPSPAISRARSGIRSAARSQAAARTARICCKKEIPKLVDTGDGHMVACFLYE